MPSAISFAWPDPFRAAAYRLEIISSALQRSGIVRDFKKAVVTEPKVVSISRARY